MDLKVIPVLQVIIAAALMFFVSSSIPSSNYVFTDKNHLVKIIFILALLIGLSAIYAFKKHQTTVDPSHPEKSSKVVDSGIYRYSRNPMYLALILVLIALAIYFSNIACFAVIPLFIAYISQFQIKPEERALQKLFGEDYVTYSKKVRRWL